MVVTDMAGSFLHADETANDSDSAAEAVHANKWQTPHRYMMVEAFARIVAEEIDPILGVTPKAA